MKYHIIWKDKTQTVSHFCAIYENYKILETSDENKFSVNSHIQNQYEEEYKNEVIGGLYVVKYIGDKKQYQCRKICQEINVYKPDLSQPTSTTPFLRLDISFSHRTSWCDNSDHPAR